MSKQEVNIFWFRRDLRMTDNTALFQCFSDGLPVLPVFIFDKLILDKLEDPADRRVEFIHNAVNELRAIIEDHGSAIETFHDKPQPAFAFLMQKYIIRKVYVNDDYEPYARERDALIKTQLAEKGISFHAYKDHVLFEKSEVVKDDGKPYTIFTPYGRKWKAKLDKEMLQPVPSAALAKRLYQQPPLPIPSLEQLGFTVTGTKFPAPSVEENILAAYHKDRDIPGINGTSKLGVHLRFGTVSIRQVALKAFEISPVFLNELAWRDFYHTILWHFPQVGRGASFKPAYDNIEWRTDEGEFERWCNGTTGYPIVDAGMRELNATGFMHNRVRMITASFLCKHLLLDWRLGESYFAAKLLDFDLASNNGGWQWASGSGCDATPYFRIFNPYLQTKKFDPQLAYVRTWVPEFQEFTYPLPIIEHEVARKRCLEVYARSLNEKK